MSGKKGSEIKWCAYCGIQAPNGAVFCPRCGEPLDPSYVYDESISPEEAVVEGRENLRIDEIIPAFRPPAVPEVGIHVLYEGTFRGLVTGESERIQALVGETSEPNIFAPVIYGRAEACFVMKLEEGFEGVPSEILVQTLNFCYFWKGDEVILQGKLFKIVLSQWKRPMYTIFADHFYNESLQTGDEESMKKKQILYRGEIRGTVTRESKTNFANYYYSIDNPTAVYFFMKLEEDFEGVPSEILVRSYKEICYFSKGDKVILRGEILKQELKQWSRPMYIIRTEHSYNESLQIGSEGSRDTHEVLYQGMMRGLVTREPIIWYGFGNPFTTTHFVMKLEENIAGVPPEILVQAERFGYLSIGDKVILQGTLIKENLEQWSRPMYTVIADNFYNESLKIGDLGLTAEKRESYRGMIRGIVTGESRTRIEGNTNLTERTRTYFAMRLEGNIGIEGMPDEMLVRSEKAGYFRTGDKVILRGRILEGNLRRWNKPMYLIIADHYYNESLQIGD